MARPRAPSDLQTVPAIHRRVPQYLARRFWQIAQTLQADALSPHGLVPWHAALLAQLADTPGMDRNWFAAAVGLDATSTGQALAGFEARGLVRREANPQDQRANAFFLTEAGQALRAELAVATRQVADTLLAPLTPEEGERLLALLARVVDAHQSHARPGAGRKAPRRRGQSGGST